MKNTGRIKLEKETSITFNEKEAHAVVWTASDITENKLIKLGLKGESWGGGVRWNIPKSWIKIRKPRDLTEEQRNDIRIRFKKAIS